MKIGKVPAFLRAVARAHNKVVDGLQAGMGIRISKSNGNILIENTAPATIGGGAEGAARSVVGSTGSLQLVPRHSTWIDPDISPVYPTKLKAVDGGASSSMDDRGIVSTGAGLDFQHDPVNGFCGWYVGARKVEIDGFGAGGYDLQIVSGGVVLTHSTSGKIITLKPNGDEVRVENPSVAHASVKVAGFESVDDAGSDFASLKYLDGLQIEIGDVTIAADDGGLVLTHVPSGRTITLADDATKVEVATSAGDYGKVYTTGVEGYDISADQTVALDANGGLSLTDGTATTTIAPDGTFTINNGTNNLTIDPADITEDMAIQTIDVCDSGTPKQMLIIGSAPF